MTRIRPRHASVILTGSLAVVLACAADSADDALDGDTGAGDADDGGDDGGDDGSTGDDDDGDDGDPGDDGGGDDGGTEGETDTGSDDLPPPADCTSWKQQDGSPQVDWFDMAWLDADRALVVGVSGNAIATNDRGEHWNVVDVGTTDDLRTVSFAPGDDADHGWIFGGGDVEEYTSRPTTIVHTTDGGGSWSPQSTGIAFPPTRVDAIDSQHAFAVWGLGDLHPDGHWQRTDDAGARWSPGGSGTDFSRPLRALLDVQFVDDLEGWAVGVNLYFEFNINGMPSNSPINTLGGILHTTDFGNTWEVQTTSLPEGIWFTGVSFVDSDHGWVTTDAGQILTTENGGASWTNQSSGVSTALRSVAFRDESVGWAVGASGVILHTEDGGTSWTPQESGTSAILRRVVMPPGGNPWIVGDGGALLACE